MRIAQVAPLYESVPPKFYGGTERVVSYLTEELVRQGHDVTLFASGDSITRARLHAIVPNGLRLERPCVDSIAHHVHMIEKVGQLADEFDVIHFHTGYLHFPVARMLQTPHVTTYHGRLDLPDIHPLFREFADMPAVSISNAQRTPMPFLNWQATVYHGLPHDMYPFRKRAGDYLVFVGRVSPEKRVDRAIEIAKRAGRKLYIAAKVDEVDRAYFETSVQPLLDHPLIEFIGEVGESEKRELLGGAYAFVFPIDWPEPFGLVMIEALACGTPVVAYPCGSVPEVIRHGETGFIVHDIDQAVAALARVGEIDRARCRADFEERFSATRMAHDYLAAYRAAIKPAVTSRSVVSVA